MSALFRNRFHFSQGDTRNSSVVHSASGNDIVQVSDGDLKYLGQHGGNTSEVGYQEATGAPVEVQSPLGYNVGPITIVFLNVGKMIGTGIFSTPSAILKGTGSVGLSLVFWFIGLLTTLSGLSVYLEYAACFPSRSGSEVAYLEQAYPRPKWFFPTTFAIQTIILSFSSGNSVVMAKYLFAIGGYTATNWELKGLAIGCYTMVLLSVAFSTRFSYAFANVITAIKATTLVFIAITGLVVLGGHTKVEDPTANFRNAFGGSASTYGVTNAMYKIVFAYSGFENAFNVVNEVKNPVKSVRNSGFSAAIIVAVLYMLVNIAFFAAIPKADILAGKEIAAGLLFTRVFGNEQSVRGLNFLIALSAFGSLISTVLGTSRMIRECGRQGVLPFASFWASTKPFGTPIGPYLVKYTLTIIMILGPPAGDAFNFTTDVQVYPGSIFSLLMGIGIYVLRHRRSKLGLPRASFRAWDVALVFNIAVQLYLIVISWYPPDTGANGGDVSFWYGTYIVVGIGVVLLCALYYLTWIVLLPKIRGYKIRQELLDLDDGAQTHVLVRVPLDQLEQWDAAHDANGGRHGSSDGSVAEKITITAESKGAAVVPEKGPSSNPTV